MGPVSMTYKELVVYDRYGRYSLTCSLYLQVKKFSAMAPKKNTRYCNKCSFKHEAPTGKKCKRQEEEELENDLVDIFGENYSNSAAARERKTAERPVITEQGEGATAVIPASTLDAMEARFDKKIEKLEKLLNKSANRKAVDCYGSDISSGDDSAEEEDEIRLHSGPRAVRRRKEKEQKLRHDNFMTEGETVVGFNSIMLLNIRTI